MSDSLVIWQRRVCEAAVVVGLFIAVMWLCANFSDLAIIKALEPSLAGVAVGIVGAAFGVAGIVKPHGTWLTWTGLTALLSMSCATLVVVAQTDILYSPYIMMWVMCALFASVFGLRSLAPIATATVAATIYLVLKGEVTDYNWILFGLVGFAPLVVSYLLWSHRLDSHPDKHSDVSALAAELDRESNKSNIIVNAIADGVIVIDEQCTIQLVNPAALTIVGWGKDDALKLDYRSVLKIIDKQDSVVTEQNDPVQHCLVSNQTIITEDFGIRTASGKKLLASLMVSPVGESGKGAVIVFRDITAARAEEREQAEFISTASHEMRTPVAAIEGYLGLALNPATATIDEKARTYLLKAHESSQHLGRLFQDLLDISRVEDGRLHADIQVVDVIERCRGIVGDFATSAQEKGLTLTYKPDTADGTAKLQPIYYVHVDMDQFREVIGNLIENAIKYTREGSVSIDVKGTDERVFISIQDSGVGIPAEDIPHLFQKFYRVDNSDTREIGGTGLGLYLSRRLTENMDGKLTVDSEYGRGSTFTVELPRLAKEKAEQELQQRANQGSETIASPTLSEQG